MSSVATRIFDRDSNNWSKSEIRRWLNAEFLNNSFNESEQKRIINSELSDVGTTDKIFLLSKKETDEYFSSESDRAEVYNGDFSFNSESFLRTKFDSKSSIFFRSDLYAINEYGDYYNSGYSSHNSGNINPGIWVKLGL